MGILDDAIREHLELRRSRGAETEEISEIQHEVLGALTPTIAEGLEAVPDDADVTTAEPVAAAAETAPEPAEPHAEAPEPDRHPEPVEQPHTTVHRAGARGRRKACVRSGARRRGRGP